MIVLIALLLAAAAPITPVAANPTHTIDQFTDHGASASLLLDSNMTTWANVTLQRNTTIQSATFQVSYDDTDETPGTMRIDVGGDNQDEWRFGGGSAGDLGQQSNFVNGMNTTTNPLTGGAPWATVDGFLIPATAQIGVAEVNLTFEPNMGGGFAATGHLDELLLDDADGDGLPEPIHLKRGHTLSNGSVHAHIGFTDWTSMGWGTSVWEPTCAGATEMVTGEFSNDSRADVLAIDRSNGVLCIHESTPNGWTNSSNLTIGPEFADADLEDMDGDSLDDLVIVESDGTLAVMLWRNGSFSSPINVTVSSNSSGGTGGGGPGGGPGGGGPGGGSGGASLSSLAAGLFWPSSTSGTVAVTDQSDGHVKLWNLSAANGTFEWTFTEISFDGISGDIEAIDVDLDGDLDLFGDATSMGSTLAVLTGGSYAATMDSSPSSLHNATFADWQGNGTVDRIIVDQGTPDGNDATVTGGLEMRSINGTNISSSSWTTITAHTAPRILRVGDLDGDGAMEHVVAAGESTAGIWAAGWHYFQWDLNGDSVVEAEVAGHAGDGVGAAPGPLSWFDEQGGLTNVVQNHLGNAPVQSDLYGTYFANFTPAARSRGDGAISAHSLTVSYGVSLMIQSNPSTSDLASSLNRMMMAGSGGFDVDIGLFASANGTVTLDSLSIQYVAGAPNLALPPTPVLNFHNKSDQHVMFDWTGVSHEEETFLEYQVFRVPINDPMVLNLPHETTMEARYVDFNVENMTYDYAVRAVHENGVTSNLSDILTVTVPETPPPPPDLTPPKPVTGVIALDVPADNGGAIVVNWTIGSDSDIAHHLVYVSTSSFSNASLLAPVVNLSANDSSVVLTATSAELDGDGVETSASASLIDGVDIWVAVAAMDDAGNINHVVNATGPVAPSNDSTRASSLTLSIDTGEDQAGIAIAQSGAGLSISATLSSEGEALAGRTVDFEIQPSGGAAAIALSASTGPDGIASIGWSDWIDFQSERGPIAGDLSVSATFNDSTYGLDQQSLTGSTDSASMLAKVDATFTVAQSSVQLDGAGMGSATVRLMAQNAIEQALLTGSSVVWSITNATNGTTGSNGTATIDAQGSATVVIDFYEGGEITFSLDAAPTWLVANSSSVVTDLLPPTQTGGQTGPVDGGGDGPIVLNPVGIDCGTDSWLMPDDPVKLAAEADENRRSCTITNPNDVRVFVDLDLSVSVIGITFAPSTGTSTNIGSNDSQTFELTPEPGASLRGGKLTITVSISATDRTGASNSTEIAFGFTETLVEDDTNNGTSQIPPSESSRGANTATMALVGGFGLIIAIGAILLGRRLLMSDLEEEGGEEYDPDEIKSIIRESRELPTTRSLDEMSEDDYGREYHEEDDFRGAGSGGASRAVSRSVSMKKPKRLMESPSATLDNVLEKVRESSGDDGYDDDYDEGYSEEYDDDYEDSFDQSDLADDPNYSMDDDGTEWWKDEDGVWWWRAPGEEDWLEYES